jgi:hypothetical protein
MLVVTDPPDGVNWHSCSGIEEKSSPLSRGEEGFLGRLYVDQSYPPTLLNSIRCIPEIQPRVDIPKGEVLIVTH